MSDPGAHSEKIDHLARLFFIDGSAQSSGSYLPRSFDLRQTGADQVVDRIVHVHEAHHSVLNASTAWGNALLITAGVASWRRLFGLLLDACRTTHEVFATFMSVSMVSARHGDAIQALAAYPAYEPLHRAAQRATRGVTGPHRRGLAMSALARVCMQTPVLDRLLEGPVEEFTFSRIRNIDIPDTRWHWLLRNGVDDVTSSAGAEADDRVARQFGMAALRTDESETDPALSDSEPLEEAWALWESTLYRALARVLEGGGATIMGESEHIENANELAGIAASQQKGFRLSVQSGALPSSASWKLAAAVTRQGRHWLASEPIASRLITAGQDAGLDEVVRVVDANCRVEGTPSLVISARLARRLVLGYRFDEAGRAAFESRLGEPIVAVRAIADEGDGSDVLWHAQLPSSRQLAELADRWNQRGPLLSCVAASCFVDERWQAEWVPMLQKTGPLTVLLDVGLEAVVSSWQAAGGVVEGFYIPLTGSHGERYAVALRPYRQPALWLAVADYTGIESLVSQLADIEHIDLRLEAGDWSGWTTPVRFALIHLLATESFVDFNALDGYPWTAT